jgi:predicted unusual protein kinase regulating ubiquinone biosynthesis (AarF/ABC1/UbiB family)
VRGVAAEAKRQLQQEADYIAEGRFLQRFATLIADEPDLLVPRVHWDFTTARVMAMDYVEGVPLEYMAGSESYRRAR